MWIPMTLGMPTWPVVGGPIALIAAIGAWWRFLALRSIDGAVQVSRPRAWKSLAALGGLVGLVQAALTCLRGLGVPLPEVEWLLPSWAAITALEVAAAMLWLLRGSWERGSRWMGVLLGIAGTVMLASTGAQTLAASADGAPRFVQALFVAVSVLGGVVGPLLIGDGAARLAVSLCSESLDEETERAMSRGGRTPAD